MNWFRRLFIKEDWQLVRSLDSSIHWTDVGQVDRIYYHLYESNFGNRYADILESGLAKSYKSGKESTIYMKKIHPWLKGATFEDIPAYKFQEKPIQSKPKKEKW